MTVQLFGETHATLLESTNIFLFFKTVLSFLMLRDQILFHLWDAPGSYYIIAGLTGNRRCPNRTVMVGKKPGSQLSLRFPAFGVISVRMGL
ncbi:MAG: hypothetical protein IK145_02525 [Bacteroidales bacterium]|nr:hypothetical protein [Bacteroidales bacterium]